MIFKWLIIILSLLLEIYGGIMTLSIFLSWIPGSQEIGIFRLLRSIGDWYLGSFRGRFVYGPLDFTPMVGLIIYGFIVNLLYIWI